MEIKLSEVLKRELRGQTLTAVSKELGIPKTLLCEWQNGRLPSGKSIVHLKTLSKYLSLNLEQLLFNSSVEEKIIISSTTFTDTQTNSEYRFFIEKQKKGSEMNEIKKQNKKLFDQYLKEVEFIKKEHNFNNEDIAEMLTANQDLINSLLEGNQQHFTAALWVRSVYRMGIDSAPSMNKIITEIEGGL